MKAYEIKFAIDGHSIECLIVAENEDGAKEHLLNNYLGIAEESIEIELIKERMIIETDLSF